MIHTAKYWRMTCDECHGDRVGSLYGERELIRDARERGWFVAKHMKNLCPACNTAETEANLDNEPLQAADGNTVSTEEYGALA